MKSVHVVVILSLKDVTEGDHKNILLKDNKEFLPPKKLTDSKLVKETREGKTGITVNLGTNLLTYLFT